MVREETLDQAIADFRQIKLEDYALPYHYVIALLTLMRAAGWRDMDYGTLVVESGVGLSFGYIRNHCVAIYSLQEGIGRGLCCAGARKSGGFCLARRAAGHCGPVGSSRERRNDIVDEVVQR